MKPRSIFALAASALLALPAAAQDMPLTDVLLPGEGWACVADGYAITDGACTDADGNFYFSDVAKGEAIYRLDAQTGKLTEALPGFPGISALQFGPGGKLYACQAKAGRVLRIDPATGQADVLAEGVKPNDLAVTKEGAVYFTETPKQQITYISPAGEVRAADTGTVNRPNGITLTPDEGTLLVSDHGGERCWAFRVEPDGALAFKAPYITMRLPDPDKPESSKGDGMTADAAGRIYVTTAVGLQMFDPTGRMGGVIAAPQNKPLVSVEFAGPSRTYLYVCCGDKIYRRKTKSPGALPGIGG